MSKTLCPSNMPKVLIFKETLLPPSETFIVAQTGALQRYQPVFAGLEVTRPSLEVPDPVLLTSRPGRVADIRAKIYRRTGIAPLFHRRARHLRVKLVHAHFGTGGLSAMPLVRSLRCPLLVTLHGADITVRSARERYAKLGEVASRIFCVSEFIRTQAIAAGLPANKLVVQYIGIDRSLFAPSTEPSAPTAEKEVLFVGRLVEKKGCEYLIRAMQLVQRKNPGTRLTIVGSGPLRAALQELAVDLGIQCTFLGLLPASEVKERLRQAYLFCAPSIEATNGDSEGFGMVFAEAQAMGVPVVSSLHGGIREIVENGVTGLLVPERDYEALAAALDRLLNDDSLYQPFRLAAVNRVARHFDLNRQTALLEDAYDEIANDGAQ